MERILLIGCSGAGKSTFSRRLHQIFPTHELIYLDKLYWQPDWIETSKEEWQITVNQLVAKERWIMDGNYGGTLRQRIARADTIVFFDFPTWRCILGVTKRILSNKLGFAKRPDITEGCPERWDWIFYKWILNYNKKTRPAVFKSIKESNFPSERLFIVKNNRDLNQLLLKLKMKLINYII